MHDTQNYKNGMGWGHVNARRHNAIDLGEHHPLKLTRKKRIRKDQELEHLVQVYWC